MCLLPLLLIWWLSMLRVLWSLLRLARVINNCWAIWRAVIIERVATIQSGKLGLFLQSIPALLFSSSQPILLEHRWVVTDGGKAAARRHPVLPGYVNNNNALLENKNKR